MTRDETRYQFTALVHSSGRENHETLAYATVSPDFIVTQHLARSGWNVTHVWTGRKVAGPFPLRKARLIAAVFGALPVEWSEVTVDNAVASWKAHLGDWTEWRKSL